jgi:hypothetical protein
VVCVLAFPRGIVGGFRFRVSNGRKTEGSHGGR